MTMSIQSKYGGTIPKDETVIRRLDAGLTCASRTSLQLLLLLSAMACISADATTLSYEIDASGSVTEPEASNDEQCTLYLAPSTIPGANLGMFTAKAMNPMDQFAGGDVAFPMIDIPQHLGEKPGFSHFEHYTWQAQALGMQREAFHHNDGFAPGLYCATNCWLPLLNIDGSIPEQDTAGLHRAKDPGAGAITPYHNATVWAITPIPVGAELFIDYGDSWFSFRTHSFGLVPLSKDYPKAESMIEAFFDLSLPSNEARESLWTIIKSIPYESRLMNAFPNTYAEAELVAKRGMVGLHQPNHIHSLKFLKQHGTCLDHMVPGYSTIAQAGRGAFAARALSRDQLITTTPLLHIPFRSKLLTMYEKDWHYNKREGHWHWTRNSHKIVGEQLVVNYCFGHVESTMLLCPYSTGVGYINHSHENPNVKIQWAKDGRIGHQDMYLTLQVTQFINRHKVGLALDIVALRDIEPGEELLLDYGDAWEVAWNDHVASWAPVDDADQYHNATTWNDVLHESPFRTQEEQETDPYPSNILIHCHTSLGTEDFEALDIADELWKPGETGVSCTIHERYVNDDGNTVYDVELEDETYVSNVPKIAMRFVDEVYTTDIHLPNAFRHPMQLPDAMVPDQWRNLRTTEV